MVALLTFLLTSGLLASLFFYLNRDQLQGWARVRDLGPGPSATAAPGTLERLAARVPAIGMLLLPADEAHRTGLEERLRQAGLYSQHAAPAFLAARIILLLVGTTAAVALWISHVLPPPYSLSAATIVFGLPVLAPGLWLASRKRARAAILRRAMPDFLDMLVLCMEGGLSIDGAFQRVTAEMQAAHPLFGVELNIAEREILLGLSVGEVLQRFARRADLEEARTLATILLQAERYGVSVAKALRIHADSLRQQRRQRAEELAQKTAVKILFPTLLCIFPAIFIVILGPAALQIMNTLSRMK